MSCIAFSMLPSTLQSVALDYVYFTNKIGIGFWSVEAFDSRNSEELAMGSLELLLYLRLERGHLYEWFATTVMYSETLVAV